MSRPRPWLRAGVVGWLVVAAALASPGPAPLPTATTILIYPPWQDDIALRLAESDLTSYLSSRGVVWEKSDKPASPHWIGVGPPDWLGVSLPATPSEGYSLVSGDWGEVPYLAVAASDVLGASYGVFRLIEQLRLDPSAWWNLSLHARPAIPLRLIADPLDPFYPAPEDALRWGFNAVTTLPWPSLALYPETDLYDPSTYPTERAWVERNRRLAQERIDVAKRLHLKVVSLGDVFSFPRHTPSLFPATDLAGRYDLSDPWTRRLLLSAIDEVLIQFPAIDALMVRTGESYPLGPLAGNSVSCPQDYSTCLAELIEVVREAVVDGHGKEYIHRAWDLGPVGFHANPQVAQRVMAQLNPRTGLTLSFKHTATDFWRFIPTNPNLGTSSFPVMVEFQAAREYEGKGAFPNYLGEVWAQGAPEAAGGPPLAHLPQAIWVWGRGGGWGGPHPELNLWIEANIYALNRLAWEPRSNPYLVARDWASLRFGPRAADPIAQMLLRSPKAVLGAFYIGPYAPKRGAWEPNFLWTRDDVIYGQERVVELYRLSGEDLAIVLDEKAQAEVEVDGMLRNFSAASLWIADRALAQAAGNTLIYEKTLVATLRYYLAGMFYYYRWLDDPRPPTKLLALENLRLAQTQWRRHQAASRLPGSATPYRSLGMEETVAAALSRLTGQP